MPPQQQQQQLGPLLDLTTIATGKKPAKACTMARPDPQLTLENPTRPDPSSQNQNPTKARNFQA